LLASSSEENHEVRLWDLASGRLVADWGVVGGRAQVSFRLDGRALAVIAGRGAVLYALSGLDVQAPLALHAGPVRAIAFHPSGTALACLAETIHGETPSWELDGWPLRVGLSRPSFTRRCLRRKQGNLAFAPDGRCLLHTDGDGVSRWDLTTGADTSINLGGQLDRLRFARDGRLWVVDGDEVRAWDLPGKEPVAHWSNQVSAVLTGLGGIKDLAAGQHWVAVAGRDGLARLLRASDAGLASSRLCGNSPLSAAALNASETVAAVGTEQGEIILLDVPSGEVLSRLPAHTDVVTSLVFAGDTLLVSGSRDRTVRLTKWDSRVARHLFTLRLGGSVVQVCFTPDNRCLAVLLHEERAVHLWRLERLWTALDALSPENPLPPLPDAPALPAVPPPCPSPVRRATGP
jgi:WD40 repeat protein